MPIAVALLQCIGVGGCGCPISCKVIIIILDSFAFRNSAPISASASDAAINLSIWHKVNIAPLICMGCLSCGFHRRNKCPAALLIASLADKYEKYEWKFSIMLDA